MAEKFAESTTFEDELDEDLDLNEDAEGSFEDEFEEAGGFTSENFEEPPEEEPPGPTEEDLGPEPEDFDEEPAGFSMAGAESGPDEPEEEDDPEYAEDAGFVSSGAGPSFHSEKRETVPEDIEEDYENEEEDANALHSVSRYEENTVHHPETDADYHEDLDEEKAMSRFSSAGTRKTPYDDDDEEEDGEEEDNSPDSDAFPEFPKEGKKQPAQSVDEALDSNEKIEYTKKTKGGGVDGKGGDGTEDLLERIKKFGKSTEPKNLVISTAIVFVFFLIVAFIVILSIFGPSSDTVDLQQNQTPYLTYFGVAAGIGIALTIAFSIGRYTINKKQIGDEKYETSNTGMYGGAKFASDDKITGADGSRKAVRFDAPDRPTDIAVGFNEEKNVSVVDCANNMNIAVYGASGSGKSFGYVKPNILMCIDMKKSFVVTDPSGELFRDTAKLAARQGMKVRVLNLKHIAASNAWDFLMPLKIAARDKDPSKVGLADQLADQLVQVIMDNTKDEGSKGDSYFDDIARNLFLFLVRYVAMSPNFHGEEHERNIGTCYDILSQLLGSKGEYPLFDQLPPDDPAYQNWKNFSGLSDNQKSSAMTGLEGKIHVFQNEMIQEIFSHDEIDLRAPGEEPCAYYLISSVTDNTFKFVQSLFFSMIFQQLIEEGEEQIDNRLKVPVYFLLDEFKAIGKINAFEEKMANVRKYGISISIIFQDPTQLTASYGTNVDSILSNCAIHVVLGVNSNTTADALSKRSGVMTVKNHSVSQVRSTYNIFNIQPATQNVSTADGKRNLMNLDEVLTLGDDYTIMVVAQNKYPYLCKSYIFPRHWLYKFTQKPSMHLLDYQYVPEWQNETKTMDKKHSFRGPVPGTAAAMGSQSNSLPSEPEPVQEENIVRSGGQRPKKGKPGSRRKTQRNNAAKKFVANPKKDDNNTAEDLGAIMNNI